MPSMTVNEINCYWWQYFYVKNIVYYIYHEFTKHVYGYIIVYFCDLKHNILFFLKLIVDNQQLYLYTKAHTI